jgi:hypothetical protein
VRIGWHMLIKKEGALFRRSIKEEEKDAYV